MRQTNGDLRDVAEVSEDVVFARARAVGIPTAPTEERAVERHLRLCVISGTDKARLLAVPEGCWQEDLLLPRVDRVVVVDCERIEVRRGDLTDVSDCRHVAAVPVPRAARATHRPVTEKPNDMAPTRGELRVTLTCIRLRKMVLPVLVVAPRNDFVGLGTRSRHAELISTGDELGIVRAVGHVALSEVVVAPRDHAATRRERHRAVVRRRHSHDIGQTRRNIACARLIAAPTAHGRHAASADHNRRRVTRSGRDSTIENLADPRGNVALAIVVPTPCANREVAALRERVKVRGARVHVARCFGGEIACVAEVASPTSEFAVRAHRDTVTISRGDRHTRPEVLRHHAFPVRISSPCTHQSRLGFDRQNALHTRCNVLDRRKPRGHIALAVDVAAPARDAAVLRIPSHGERITDKEPRYTAAERGILRRVHPSGSAPRRRATPRREPSARKRHAPRFSSRHRLHATERLRHIALSFVVFAPRDEWIGALCTRDSRDSERCSRREEIHTEVHAEASKSSLEHEGTTFS